jgi:hypothetical protein
LTLPLPPAPKFEAPDFARLTTGADRFAAAKQYQTRLEQYWLSPEGKAHRRSERSYLARIGPDGSFRIEDVPPGTYDLSVDVRFIDLPNLLLPTVLHDIRVPKPAGTAEVAPLDLGVIKLNGEGESTTNESRISPTSPVAQPSSAASSVGVPPPADRPRARRPVNPQP